MTKDEKIQEIFEVREIRKTWKFEINLFVNNILKETDGFPENLFAERTKDLIEKCLDQIMENYKDFYNKRFNEVEIDKIHSFIVNPVGDKLREVGHELDLAAISLMEVYTKMITATEKPNTELKN